MLIEDTYRKMIASYRGSKIVEELPEKLIPVWCKDYHSENPKSEVVEVDLSESGTSFSYLFDIDRMRTIVAFGVPIFAKHRRDAARMAGHPLSDGSRFHRGHLMAHSIGGGTDINLVPQLGKLNIGEFRVLERRVRDQAEQNLPCFYFVRPIYNNKTPMPQKFEQCVILPPKGLIYALHKNS
jgi:hypothetical protein